MQNKFLQLFRITIVISFLSITGATFADQALDSIIAIVNSSVITQSQFDQQKSLEMAQLQQTNAPIPPAAKLNQQVLDNMIDMELGLQEAKAQKISVSQAQLNQALSNIAKQNNMTIDQLSNAVAQQGLDWGLYRQQIQDQMTINAVEQAQLANTIIITQADVDQYLKTHAQLEQVTQYHLQGILVPVDKTASADQVLKAQKQAQTIVASLQAGENFNTTAVDESTGEKLQGGDMGWRTLAQLPPQLANMLITAKPGAVFGPLQSAQGFYVFKYIATQTVPMQHFTPNFQIRTILLAQDQFNDANAVQAKLQKIQAALAQGTSFTQLAQQYSQDSQKGNLIWITGNVLDPTVVNALLQLKVGQVSQPLQTSRGIELFQLNAIKQVNDTHDYLVAQAKQALFQQKGTAAAQAWLAQLKANAYIKIIISNPS